MENFFIFGLKLKTDFLTLTRIKNELFVITRFSSFCTWQLVSIILFCYDLRQLDGPGIKNKIHPPTPFFSKIWMTKIRLDKMSGLIWIQTIWQTDRIPERFFWKKYLKKEKKNPQTTKSMQNDPACRPRVKLLVTTAEDRHFDSIVFTDLDKTKYIDIFLLSLWKIGYGYSLDVPCQGDSN